MIVLHRPRLIFLKARKIAGTSFEIALSKYATADCIITPVSGDDESLRQHLGYRGPQHFKPHLTDIPNLPKRKALKRIMKGKMPLKFYNQISADEAKFYLGNDLWSKYLKVSIVRNPFDYAVSRYFWKWKSTTPQERPDFESWCLSNINNFCKNREQYFIGGYEVIDYFIRYENLESDISNLEKLRPSLEGLWDEFRAITAKGDARPAKATTPEMFRNAPRAREEIRRVFRYEIDRFGFIEP